LNNESLSLIGMPLASQVINDFYNAAVKSKRQLNLFFDDATIKNYYFGESVNIDIQDPNFYVAGPSIYNYSNVDEVTEDLKKPIVHVSLKAEQEIIKQYYPKLKK